MSAVHHITEENFDELVVRSEKKVLLDFWATWCGPCKMIAPIVEEIASERNDILVGKVDVDTQLALAHEFHVVSIPTLVVLEGGEELNRTIGYQSKEELLALL